MSARRNLETLMFALAISVLLAGLESVTYASAVPGAARGPVPGDGATSPAENLGRRLGMELDYLPGLGAISHTGYFSDDYNDVAAREPARSLGAPPFPATSPTAFFVGYHDAAIPAFAQASLSKGKTYYWAVDEFDGMTVWPGDVWSFTVMPDKAWGPAPADDSSDIVAEPHAILRWHMGDVDTLRNTVSYNVYYGTDSSVVAAATEPDVTLTAQEYALAGLLPGAECFWRVDTVLTGIAEPFAEMTIKGDVWSFTVILDEERAWGPMPADGAVRVDTEAGLTLRWQVGDIDTELYAIEYDVYHGTDAVAVRSATSPELTTPNRYLEIARLPDGIRYFWRVNVVRTEKSPPFERKVFKGEMWSFDTFGIPSDFSVDDDGSADFSRIQDAIDAADHGDTIIVYDGTYVGEGNYKIDFKGKSIRLKSRKGPENCIIDCEKRGRGFYFRKNETSSAILDGFTIMHGDKTGNHGGAIYTKDSSPTIMNCIITNNVSRVNSSGQRGIGGGIAGQDGSPTVINCVFTDNSAHYGGGMAFYRASPRIANCILTGNYASRHGGGIYYNAEVTGTVENCSFIGNSAKDKGGGAFNGWENSRPRMRNCTFVENNAPDGGGIWNDRGHVDLTDCLLGENTAGYGGAICNESGTCVAVNCTLSGNSAHRGSGIFFGAGTLIVRNCILWSKDGDEIWKYKTSPEARVAFSNVRGGWSGQGNINADPRFADPSNHDCHLLPDSPCINAGDPAYTASYGERDIDGESRVMGGRLDIGADESNPFLVTFAVVGRERVGRSVFEYECEVELQNISAFAVQGIGLEMVGVGENMTIIDARVSFGDGEIGAGESATSVDTCIFRVDRSGGIDSGKIVWRVAGESVGGGAKMGHTSSSPVPLGAESNGFDGLEDIAAKWLWQGLAGGIEEDSVEDGTVNLADFARFAEQWEKD